MALAALALGIGAQFHVGPAIIISESCQTSFQTIQRGQPTTMAQQMSMRFAPAVTPARRGRRGRRSWVVLLAAYLSFIIVIVVVISSGAMCHNVGQRIKL